MDESNPIFANRNSVLDSDNDPKRLEYALPDRALSREGHRDRGNKSPSKARILVVEDESIIALDIEHSLRCLGYTVVGTVSTGEDAVREAGEIRPDLVLMDINLKGTKDGVQAAWQIRERFDIPVVYLTAHADEATLQRAKLTEPLGYILKPFEDQDLHSTIEIALCRHRTERKLRESERWLATTLRSIGDAVIATDDQGRVTFVNPVAEALTRWGQSEALGKDFTEIFRIIHEETQTPIESPAARVLRENMVVDLGDHVLLVAKDGTQTPIGDSAAPIQDDRGNLIGVVVVFRDIAERVRAERALQRYARELQVRNEDLDAFAHTVAHDLKAPLNVVIGFSRLLENDYDDLPTVDLREYLHQIGQSGRKMSNIIDELLLLAHVRSTKVGAGPLPMTRIVAEAQDRLSCMIEEYEAEIVLPDNWPSALGYAPWIEEVWVNYLSNGIKYGGRPPRLELGAIIQPDGMVRFWVRDNGAGLSPQEQAELFKPFTQLSRVRATGHGLGLSIVRRIVEQLGGQVSVQSELGRGSVFFFALPRATR